MKNLPPWPYARAFVWRALIVWLALHIMTHLVTLSLVFSLRASLFALAVTVILVLLDAERRSERRFLANLGISRIGIGAVALLTALGLEALLLSVAEPLSQFIAGGLLDR